MSKAAKKSAATAVQAKHYDVLLAPVITEKATRISEQNKVVFRIRPETTKADVKSAVEALFGVKVKSVNTVLTKGKTKRFRGFVGVRQDSKKAIVTLEAGQSIDIAAGVK